MRRGWVIGIVLFVCVLGALIWYYTTQTTPTNTAEKPGLLGGLLPNPFGIFTPSKPTTESTDQTTQPDRIIENETETSKPLPNPIKLGSDAVIGFDAYLESTTQTVTNPETGAPTNLTTNIPFIRTVHRDDGIVTDFRITDTQILSNPITNTVIQNIGDVIVSGNSLIYRTATTSGPVASIGTINIPKTSSTNCPIQFTRTLQLGSEGRDVEYLQQLLGSYFDGTYTPGSIDAVTVAAIKKFQSAMNIPQTGTTGTQTRAQITKLCIQQEHNRLNTHTNQPKTTYTITSSPLTGIVYGLTTSPDMLDIFSIKQTVSGISGVITPIKKQTDSTIFSLPFTEWSIQWVHSGIYLTTLASGEANGSVFQVSQKTGTLTAVISNIRGLAIRAQKNGDYILLSGIDNRQVTTKLFNTKTKNTTTLSIQTFAEKCAWTNSSEIYCFVPDTLPAAVYPDAWYTRRVVTNDSLWRINSETGTVVKVIDFNEKIDADMPDVIENTGIVFRNRTDDTIWFYRL